VESFLENLQKRNYLEAGEAVLTLRRLAEVKKLRGCPKGGFWIPLIGDIWRRLRDY
jgi:hypothetical protein